MQPEQMDYEKLKDWFNELNVFAKEIGLEIIHIEEGYAKAKLEIAPMHMNPYQTLHGGVLYTMADVAGGSAALSHNRPVFTVDSQFHFLNAGRNVTCLYGEGKTVKAGKQLIVVEIDVTDQDGTLLCKGTFTYMQVSEKMSGMGPFFLKN